MIYDGSSGQLSPLVSQDTPSGLTIMPLQDSVLLWLPFHTVPIRLTFQPMAGYPKSLCLYGNIQLDPQYSQAASRIWYMDLPRLLIFDLSYTGSYAAYLSLMRLQPPWEPPYWSVSITKFYPSDMTSNIMKCCHLVAFDSGSTGTQPTHLASMLSPFALILGLLLLYLIIRTILLICNL
jgi:hypothetical protein